MCATMFVPATSQKKQSTVTCKEPVHVSIFYSKPNSALDYVYVGVYNSINLVTSHSFIYFATLCLLYANNQR